MFAVHTSSNDFDPSFLVGEYATMDDARDVARGHEFHHDVDARITEIIRTADGTVTVPHYDL